MMASEIALAIAKRNKETTETVGALRLANDADAELQELRAFVNDVATLETADGDEYQLGPRARQLAERLRVG